MSDSSSHVCPLCSLDFTGEICHSTCPFAKGCRMVRCPRCGFEFVEEGMMVSLVRRLFRTPDEWTAP